MDKSSWIVALAEVVGALIAIGGVIAGGYWFAVRAMIRALKESFDGRVDEISKEIKGLKSVFEKDQTALSQRLADLEEDHRKDREELLRDYVRREDWSRVTGSIAIRLDQIWERITRLRIKVQDGN